eukprot:TRINITY_DN104_c0_g1_i4.p1 TRINITY_DN104_c0_g1~~TRINITY_DN104_c0_g1_i4.p1  ORF type:complete len:151 (+),score=51.76 TRINITY_DN104_c0_g1_i4:79-531(+)
MEMTRSSGKGKKKDCAKCKNGGKGGSGGSSSGKSGNVYDYFKNGGIKNLDQEFGFHRSKMKNYKQDRYKKGYAVASSDSRDWTDFGSRRNLEEYGFGGLLADDGGSDDLLDEASGRQERIKKSMKKRMEKIKDIKGKQKRKKYRTAWPLV